MNQYDISVKTSISILICLSMVWCIGIRVDLSVKGMKRK